MKTYDGSCHCGRIRFIVEADLQEILECNCSVCTKKGFLHLIVQREQFRLLLGEEDLALYTFNTHVAQHRFCRICGVHPFYVPRSHPHCVDVNVRCLEGVEPSALVTRPFDGRQWEATIAAWHEKRRS